ncbi:MAG: hypothetical protein EPN88_08430 [Bacteroidetes bacterium]|nr:MAG: hypothetical protein EPN88_08430 [Bacteroidota bacterium]
MKHQFVNKLVFTTLVLIISGFCFPGFSQKKSDKSLPPGGVKLEYNYPADKSFKYVNDSKIVQTMDINGESMLVNVSTFLGCNVKSAGQQGNNLKLEIKIDSMAQFVDSPQGASGGSVNDVKGKTFNIIISPAGKTEDLTEASKIVYNIEGSGEGAMNQEFMNFFPALPKVPVKTGDTWISNDTIDFKTQTMSLWMPVGANCKYEGIEKIDGIDCAKISATLSGDRKMKTQSQGMEINTEGTFTGTQVLLFAVKEGYFVKDSIMTKMTGTIDIPDQNMTFPVVMDITAVNKIVK